MRRVKFHASLGVGLCRLQSGLQSVADFVREHFRFLHTSETRYPRPRLRDAMSELWSRWRLQTHGRSVPGKVMHRKYSNPQDDSGDLLVALAMFHGIYKRVARKVGVNEAMVSRVVHGGRSSPKISEAIHNELRSIRDYLNRTAKKLNGG